MSETLANDPDSAVPDPTIPGSVNSVPPEAFQRTARQSTQDEKIEAILHQALANPSLKKTDLVAWAMNEFGIAKRTATIYFYEAKKRYNASIH